MSTIEAPATYQIGGEKEAKTISAIIAATQTGAYANGFTRDDIRYAWECGFLTSRKPLHEMTDRGWLQVVTDYRSGYGTLYLLTELGRSEATEALAEWDSRHKGNL